MKHSKKIKLRTVQVEHSERGYLRVCAHLNVSVRAFVCVHAYVYKGWHAGVAECALVWHILHRKT